MNPQTTTMSSTIEKIPAGLSPGDILPDSVGRMLRTPSTRWRGVLRPRAPPPLQALVAKDTTAKTTNAIKKRTVIRKSELIEEKTSHLTISQDQTLTSHLSFKQEKHHRKQKTLKQRESVQSSPLGDELISGKGYCHTQRPSNKSELQRTKKTKIKLPPPNDAKWNVVKPC